MEIDWNNFHIARGEVLDLQGTNTLYPCKETNTVFMNYRNAELSKRVVQFASAN